ncbi:MAG: Gfo/Idh/MocA family oxidoreductase, partial [Planctomycetaceae bacterium]|nr:Gfo/Idh/MocA family oxidoreductase [Planctomycetaceae bacterium]
MQPTPEQTAIGIENFYAAIGSPLLRRDFLKECNAAELSSGNGLGAKYFGYGTVDKPVNVAFLGTGDEGSILLGAINPKYIRVVAIADIRPYSVWRAFHGDNYTPDIKKLRTGLIDKYGWKDESEARNNVRVYSDYKELFEKEKDNNDPATKIEAVVIALPLFLHAPAAVAAMKAGYHVLTEKLMGHTVANCKEMARAAELYQKHLATGHQRHYNVLYDHAIKMLQSGVMGNLHYIRAQWHRNNRPGSDSWQQPMPKAAKPEDGRQTGRLEKELASWQDARKKAEAAGKSKEVESWDIKIAQKESQIADSVLVEGGEWRGYKFKSAKDYGYQDEPKYVVEDMKIPYNRPAIEELIRWRLYNRTSAGLMAELGSHQLDAASIFIAAMHGGKKQYPLSVSCTETRSIFPATIEGSSLDRDVNDHIHCIFDYAADGYDPNDELGKQRKITVAYSSINGNGFGGYGETVFGTKGTLLIDREQQASLYRGAGIEDKIKI